MVEKDKSWYAYQRRLCANYSICYAMDDWLKSGWFVLANRDIEVIRYDKRMRDTRRES